MKYIRSAKAVINSLVLSTLFTTAISAATAKDIRIAVSDIGAGDKPAGGGLVDVIYQKKLLEQALGQQGVSVHWLFIKGAGPAINEGFASHQIDMAYLGDFAAIIGRSHGLDTRVIGVASRGIDHYLAVAKGENIHSLSDLKGKRIGLFRGTAAELSFVTALHSQGLTPRDVKIINLDFAAASAALAAKQIDATWGGDNTLQLQAKGIADIALSTRDLHGAGQLSGLIVVDNQFAEHNKAILQHVVDVQRQVANWASQPQNNDAFIQIMAQQSGYPESILRHDWGKSQELTTRLSPLPDPQFISQITNSVNVAREANLIRQPVDVNQWFDTSYLKTK